MGALAAIEATKRLQSIGKQLIMSATAMANREEVRIAGKTIYVPSAEICGRTVVVTGNWLRRAAVKDEDLVEGEIVEDPVRFLDGIKKSRLQADVLTFAQKVPDTTPKYGYHFEWDNWAVLALAGFADWWENKVPQETRKNVRRAAKRGVSVTVERFDDELVRGIHRLYSETPIRQGRRFWHFGKDIDTVRRESSTYLSRSEFFGAYFNNELIGFIKLVYVDSVATIMHILARTEDHDKRPMNALLAKAVEVSVQKGMRFLVYGKYVYAGNEGSPLTEFKRRNGFEEVKYPRYFVPLTAWGKLAIHLHLHDGVRRLVPQRALTLLKDARAKLYLHQYATAKNLLRIGGKSAINP
jgi:hypothetical protein